MEDLRMRARYLYEPSAHAADRDAGRPHWPAYTPLMLEPMGLAVSPIDSQTLARERWEEETAVLFLTGPVDVEATRLREWAHRGGILGAWGGPGGAGHIPRAPSPDPPLGRSVASHPLPHPPHLAIAPHLPPL